MKIWAHVLYILAIFAAGILGAVIVLTGQWLGAGNRPALDAVLHPMPVTLEKIAERDQWLLDFDVLFVPVEKVRSDSSYGLLLLIPKRDQIVNPPGGEHWFVLSGYEANDQKPLSIDGTYLKQHPGKPEVILLDFLTWAHNYAGKTLVLRSQPK